MFFVSLLAAILLQRLFELRLGAQNLRGQLDNLLVPIDTRERRQMLVLHAGWFAALLGEYAWHGETPSNSVALVGGVLLLVGAQAVRAATMRALGPHWVPLPVSFRGQTLQQSGIYRWCRHPNYWAVVVEFLVLPWLGGCYVVLIIGSLLNAAFLWRRVEMEERALALLGGEC